MPHQLIRHLLQAFQLLLKSHLEDPHRPLLLQMHYHQQGSQLLQYLIPSWIFMNEQKHSLLLKPPSL